MRTSSDPPSHRPAAGTARSLAALFPVATPLLVAVLAACGGDGSPGALSGLLGGPADDAERLEVREVLRMGGLDVPEAYLFGEISDVVRDTAGNYYVADETSVLTRVFDASGAPLRVIGRKGEGPGELLRLDDLVLGPDRLVAVNRRHGGRVVVQTLDGEVVDDWRHTRNRTRLLPLALDDDGWIVERIPFERRPPLDDGERWQSFRTLHRIAEPTDSVGRELARWVDQTWVGSPALLGPDALQPLFAHPTRLVSDGAGRFYSSEGFPYRIAVLDREGREIRTLERTVDPVPVGEGDVRDFRDRVLAVFDTLSEIPDAARIVARPFVSGEMERMASVARVEERTVVGNVVPSRDGWVWVERWDYESPARREVGRILDVEVETPNRWDVFDPSGAFVGQAVLPPRFRATWADGPSLTGVLRGPWDLELVVTWELVSPRGGA